MVKESVNQNEQMEENLQSITESTDRKSGAGKPGKGKTIALLLALALIICAAVAGTIAFLTDRTDKVENTFAPSSVSCEVRESFSANALTGVNVKNTGDIDAYIRVRLVTYRVNSAGRHIGGSAAVPAFTPGAGWVYLDGFYYYTQPVTPGTLPEAPLAASLPLQTYSDADGGSQAIEVLAEAIQAQGTDVSGKTAPQAAWGVNIDSGSVSRCGG
ncbi:MAG: hypothetical protein HUJ69_02760 [Lachnospiraceae bacterium]|nr:hypothetical protein [Lachnospiraceae bacterium]